MDFDFDKTLVGISGTVLDFNRSSFTRNETVSP